MQLLLDPTARAGCRRLSKAHAPCNSLSLGARSMQLLDPTARVECIGLEGCAFLQHPLRGRAPCKCVGKAQATCYGKCWMQLSLESDASVQVSFVNSMPPITRRSTKDRSLEQLLENWFQTSRCRPELRRPADGGPGRSSCRSPCCPRSRSRSRWRSRSSSLRSTARAPVGRRALLACSSPAGRLFRRQAAATLRRPPGGDAARQRRRRREASPAAADAAWRASAGARAASSARVRRSRAGRSSGHARAAARRAGAGEARERARARARRASGRPSRRA
jgi:hypothetical protein